MSNPMLTELRTRYREMSQEEFDELDIQSLTEVARTAYAEEQLRRNSSEWKAEQNRNEIERGETIAKDALKTAQDNEQAGDLIATKESINKDKMNDDTHKKSVPIIQTIGCLFFPVVVIIILILWIFPESPKQDREQNKVFRSAINKIDPELFIQYLSDYPDGVYKDLIEIILAYQKIGKYIIPFEMFPEPSTFRGKTNAHIISFSHGIIGDFVVILRKDTNRPFWDSFPNTVSIPKHRSKNPKVVIITQAKVTKNQQKFRIGDKLLGGSLRVNIIFDNATKDNLKILGKLNNHNEDFVIELPAMTNVLTTINLEKSLSNRIQAIDIVVVKAIRSKDNTILEEYAFLIKDTGDYIYNIGDANNYQGLYRQYNF